MCLFFYLLKQYAFRKHIDLLFKMIFNKLEIYATLGCVLLRVVYFSNYKMFHQEASAETIKMIYNKVILACKKNTKCTRRILHASIVKKFLERLNVMLQQIKSILYFTHTNLVFPTNCFTLRHTRWKHSPKFKPSNDVLPNWINFKKIWYKM